MNGLIHRHLLFGNTLNRQNLFLIFGILMCVYFSYHVLQGQRSLTGLMMLNEKIAQRIQFHADLVERRAALEKKVIKMRPGTLDPDLLEERIHAVLGYTGKDDFVITVQ